MTKGLFLLFCGKYREECLPPASHTHPGKEEEQTNFLWELQILARLPYIEHTLEAFAPHSHMFHRVRGRGSVLLFRGTLVKDNGLCVGQAEPVGPHDF